MDNTISQKGVKTLYCKGREYKLYKGRFLPETHNQEPRQYRVDRCRKIIRDGGVKALLPGDFYFAYRNNLIKDDVSNKFADDGNFEETRNLPREERIAAILADTTSSIPYLSRKYGYSSVYIRKLKKAAKENENVGSKE